ncbi:DUF3844 domain-containing protein [Mycena kentingensis (nom. inval.)]|nr:DUF3844 domain-containing protein [Mycena kentingensis (nom. inval.)]
MLSLPVELVHQIASSLSLTELKPLRATCTDLRAFLDSIVFRSFTIDITADSLDEDLARVEALATGTMPYGHFVRQLNVLGLVPIGYPRTLEEGQALWVVTQRATEAMNRFVPLVLAALEDVHTVKWTTHDNDPAGLRDIILDALLRFPLRELALVLRHGDPFKGMERLAPALRAVRRLKITDSFARSLHSSNAPLMALFAGCTQHLSSLELAIPTPMESADVWLDLKARAIHLRELTIHYMTAPLLEYLASYSGLERLTLTYPDHGTESTAVAFYARVVPAHAHTLRAFSSRSNYPSAWSFRASGAPAFIQLTALQTLTITLNARTIPGDLAVLLHTLPQLTNLESLFLWFTVDREYDEEIGPSRSVEDINADIARELRTGVRAFSGEAYSAAQVRVPVWYEWYRLVRAGQKWVYEEFAHPDPDEAHLRKEYSEPAEKNIWHSAVESYFSLSIVEVGDLCGRPIKASIASAVAFFTIETSGRVQKTSPDIRFSHYYHNHKCATPLSSAVVVDANQSFLVITFAKSLRFPVASSAKASPAPKTQSASGLGKPSATTTKRQPFASLTNAVGRRPSVETPKPLKALSRIPKRLSNGFKSTVQSRDIKAEWVLLDDEAAPASKDDTPESVCPPAPSPSLASTSVIPPEVVVAPIIIERVVAAPAKLFIEYVAAESTETLTNEVAPISSCLDADLSLLEQQLVALSDAAALFGVTLPPVPASVASTLEDAHNCDAVISELDAAADQLDHALAALAALNFTSAVDTPVLAVAEAIHADDYKVVSSSTVVSVVIPADATTSSIALPIEEHIPSEPSESRFVVDSFSHTSSIPAVSSAANNADDSKVEFSGSVAPIAIIPADTTTSFTEPSVEEPEARPALEEQLLSEPLAETLSDTSSITTIIFTPEAPVPTVASTAIGPSTTTIVPVPEYPTTTAVVLETTPAEEETESFGAAVLRQLKEYHAREGKAEKTQKQLVREWREKNLKSKKVVETKERAVEQKSSRIVEQKQNLLQPVNVNTNTTTRSSSFSKLFGSRRKCVVPPVAEGTKAAAWREEIGRLRVAKKENA